MKTTDEINGLNFYILHRQIEVKQQKIVYV